MLKSNFFLKIDSQPNGVARRVGEGAQAIRQFRLKVVYLFWILVCICVLKKRIC